MAALSRARLLWRLDGLAEIRSLCVSAAAELNKFGGKIGTIF